MPFGRTYMHDSRKSPLRERMYRHREISFDRAANMYVKQCLWLGLTCMTLDKSPLRGLLYHHRDVTFKRVAYVCENQYL